MMEQVDYIRLFERFLKKQATIEEIRLLHSWLKENTSFTDWMNEQWETADHTIPPDLQQTMLEEIRARIENTSSLPTSVVRINPGRRIWRRLAQIAATILLPLLSAWTVYTFMHNDNLPDNDMIVHVEKGQKANITLPDGSRVWINSDSKLSYGKQFNRNERVLSLEGEAYFEVKPDPTRPFIVRTEDISVKALGTSFDIKSYPKENKVSAVLITGKVEVASEYETFMLAPNQKAVFDRPAKIIEKSDVFDAITYTSWRNNQLSFDAETFENIALTLERLYNMKIVFESDALKQYRFTGTPGNNSLESILQLLSLTSPLSYEVKDSLILLKENTKAKAYYEKAIHSISPSK